MYDPKQERLDLEKRLAAERAINASQDDDGIYYTSVNDVVNAIDEYLFQANLIDKQEAERARNCGPEIRTTAA